MNSESEWQKIHEQMEADKVFQKAAERGIADLFGEKGEGRSYAILLGASDEDYWEWEGDEGYWEEDEDIAWWQDNNVYSTLGESSESLQVDPSNPSEVQSYHFRGVFKYLPRRIKHDLIGDVATMHLLRRLVNDFLGLFIFFLKLPNTVYDWLQVKSDYSLSLDWVKEVLALIDDLIFNICEHQILSRLTPTTAKKKSNVFFRYEPGQEENPPE